MGSTRMFACGTCRSRLSRRTIFKAYAGNRHVPDIQHALMQSLALRLSDGMDSNCTDQRRVWRRQLGKLADSNQPHESFTVKTSMYAALPVYGFLYC